VEVRGQIPRRVPWTSRPHEPVLMIPFSTGSYQIRCKSFLDKKPKPLFLLVVSSAVCARAAAPALPTDTPTYPQIPATPSDSLLQTPPPHFNAAAMSLAQTFEQPVWCSRDPSCAISPWRYRRTAATRGQCAAPGR
jgi:hypothetical protein